MSGKEPIPFGLGCEGPEEAGCERLPEEAEIGTEEQTVSATDVAGSAGITDRDGWPELT